MESKHVTTQPANLLPPQQASSDDTPFDTALLLAQPPFWGILITLTIITAVLGSIYTNIFKRRQRLVSPKPRDQLICHSCRYFSNNNYLHCALQPTIVLTEQSSDCPDYCP